MNEMKLVFSGWTDQWYLSLIFIGVIIAIALYDFFTKKRKRRYVRLVGYVFIALSISGLILLPKYRVAQSGDHIILLTKGYQQRVLESLMTSSDQYKLYQMSSARQPTGYPYHRIRDIYELSLHADHIDQIELLGEGLRSYELKGLDRYTVNFYAGEIPPGIVDIKFANTTEVGKTTIIKGTTNRTKESKVILINNEVKLDSVLLSTSGNFTFSLNPKATGRFNYQLQEYLGESIIGEYPIPIQVVPQQKLNILLINDFPIFDTRYLRNHLVKNGNELIVRNRYSKEKYSYEYYNSDNKISVDLASDRLKSFDMLFIDHLSLQNLTNRELRNIYLMVEKYGLTVLLQNVQKISSLARFKLFEGLSITESNKPHFVIQKGISLTEHQFQVSDSAIPISSTQSITSLGGYKYLGIGKVGVLSFQNSYELILNGYQELYASLWFDILQQIRKRSENEFQIDFEEDFPMLMSPLKVNFRSATANDYEIKAGEVKLAMKQDTQLPNRWTGKYWATREGWHVLSVDSSQYRNHRYVYNEEDWSSMKSKRRIEHTRLALQGKTETVSASPKFTYKEVSPLIFYIIFLISIAYLWIENKL